jgi:hypothetical protein
LGYAWAAFADLIFAHLSFCAATILFLPGADIVRLLGTLETVFVCPLLPLSFDHLKRWAAAMRSRAAADIFERLAFGFP